MAERKTNRTDSSVDKFIDAIKDESRRQDCRAITKLMAAATGVKPEMWGPSIVGFGARAPSEIVRDISAEVPGARVADSETGQAQVQRRVPSHHPSC